MIISICNEKGGSGKTNIAINLAVKFSLMKEDTLLLDTDPQRSTEIFVKIRTENEREMLFSTISRYGSGLDKEIRRLESKYDVVVVDTGGRDSQEMRQAMLVSDIVIIPAVPSDLDIAVLNKMINLFNMTKTYNPNAIALIVISKASPNPFLQSKVKDLKEYILEKQLEDIYLLDSILYEREAYRNSITEGQGVVEYCKETDNAYRDFNEFVNEIITYINK